MKKAYIGFLTLCVAVPLATMALAAANPAAVTYTAKCAKCHGVDGNGNTPTGKTKCASTCHTADGKPAGKAMPYFNSPELLKMSDAQLFAAIRGGKGQMPAFGNQLSDEDSEALAKYVRGLQKE
jgi:mono/diheme cytochrome c family protein